ncbi:nuclear receptor coactivator 2 [Platysternon megacephalum]|uniref:Nuclear receptor coactivator 2 n=1 Tax=Platysternon megacephalum TaxID=55544 RepID=A0A4D9EBW7_9SAUR|nr:nuclear receptor coactivator 2 [Platysternon megacephalum]
MLLFDIKVLLLLTNGTVGCRLPYMESHGRGEEEEFCLIQKIMMRCMRQVIPRPSPFAHHISHFLASSITHFSLLNSEVMRKGEDTCVWEAALEQQESTQGL